VAFVIGSKYTREQISDILGGSIQSFLPTAGGVVVCGCFKPDEDMNPDAPEEVLFGEEGDSAGINRAANLVFEQGLKSEAIPVFLKRRSNEWEYSGEYLCIGITRDPRVVARKKAQYPKRGEFHGVLRFEKV
jgi:hypothetical protein